MQQISKRVFAATNYRGCNPGYIVTSEGVILVDTPQLISRINELKEEIKDKGPVRMLINTENHIDHIFGNHWFQGIPVVGQKHILETFWDVPTWDSYDYSVDVIERQDRACLCQMPSREDFVVNKPNVLYDRHLNIRLGDTQLELFNTPGHTKAQTAVYVPEEKVVFTGDTVFSGCQVWLQEGDPDRWIKSLEFLAGLDLDYVVPGHGPVVSKNYLTTQCCFIREWVAAVSVGINKGWSKEECVERISFLERCPVDIGQEESGPMIQKLNVTHLYDFLTGQASVSIDVDERWEPHGLGASVGRGSARHEAGRLPADISADDFPCLRALETHGDRMSKIPHDECPGRPGRPTRCRSRRRDPRARSA